MVVPAEHRQKLAAQILTSAASTSTTRATSSAAAERPVRIAQKREGPLPRSGPSLLRPAFRACARPAFRSRPVRDNSEDFISVGRYMPKLSVSIWLKWKTVRAVDLVVREAAVLAAALHVEAARVPGGRPRHSVPKLVHLPV